MFDQVKQIMNLRKQAKTMQTELAKEVIEVQHKEVTIKIRGDQVIEKVFIDGEEDDVLKEAFNKAIKAAQKEAAKKMRGQLGGLNIPGLS